MDKKRQSEAMRRLEKLLEARSPSLAATIPSERVERRGKALERADEEEEELTTPQKNKMTRRGKKNDRSFHK